jgi:kynureninase
VTTAHEHLLERRADYPVLASKTYLASHTLGAMHRGTRDRLAEYTDLWAEQGVVAWETWAPHVVAVADLVGSIIGAPPGTTVMRQNVADLLGDVVTALDWRGPAQPRRHRRARLAGEPAHLQPAPPAGRRGGRRPRATRRRLVRPAALLDAVDERTRLVYVSHVLFRTSTVVDVAAVVQRAHEVGALAWSTATRPPGPSRSTSSRSTSTSTSAGR